MSFTKVDIARLKSTLLQAKLQSTNPPLYQVIEKLINNVIQLQDKLEAAITSLDSSVSSTTSTIVISNSALALMDAFSNEESEIPIFGGGGSVGAIGPTGDTGPAGVTGPPGFGFDGDDGVDSYIPGPQGIAGNPAASTYMDFTEDLGVSDRSGTFDITGLSGLTADKNVVVVQTAQAIASKGNARDEFEMDNIQLTGYVLSTTSIRVYWQAPNVVVGTYAFAYSVGA